MRDDYNGIKPGIWNAFYHLFLDDRSLALLASQCKILAESSTNFDTWNASQYSRYIKIGTRFTLEEVNKHWTWYALAETWTPNRKTKLKKMFLSAMRTHGKTYRGFVETAPARSAGPMRPNATLVANEAYHAYWESGVASTGAEQTPTDNANPLFAYSNGQEGFFTYRGVCPIIPFLLAGSFNLLQTDTTEGGTRPGPWAFNIMARLQLFDWCAASRSCVQLGNHVVLRMIVGEALAFCRTVQEHKEFDRRTAFCRVSPWRAPLLTLDGNGYSSFASASTAPLAFDVIYTSNLWDHVGILNVLIASASILKHSQWAIIYTEMTSSYGEDPTKDFLNTLCAELDTFSVLFDLAPVPYISGFRTDSNSHNLLAPCIVVNSTGQTEPVPWRRVSSLAGPQARSRALRMTIPQLLDWVFEFYQMMFPHEICHTDPESSSLLSERSRLHYSRRSLVLLLSHLVRRIDVDWDELFVELAVKMNVKDYVPLRLGYVHVPDFAYQIYSLGLYTHGTLHPMHPEIHLNRRVGKFRHWSFVPPVVCIAITVPRSVFQPLDDKEAAHNPGTSAGAGSNRASHHIVSSVETFHGALSVEGADEDTRAYISEDPLGWRGKSLIVVSFCIPTYLIMQEPRVTEIRLSVISTPDHEPLRSKFPVGRFYTKPLMDDHVLVLSQKPIVRGDPPAQLFPASPVPRAQATDMSSITAATTTTSTITLDRPRKHVAHLSNKVVITNPALKARFADKSNAVSYKAVSPYEIELLLASHKFETVSFSHPVNWDKGRIRVVRSGWIEVCSMTVDQLSSP